MVKKDSNNPQKGSAEPRLSATIDELLASALERGDDSLATGRYVVTFKENAVEEGVRSLNSQGFRVADAREYQDQSVSLESVGDAEALMLPEIGVAVIGGGAFEQRGLSIQSEIPLDSPIETIEPEYFAFANPTDTTDYLRGFVRAVLDTGFDLGHPDFVGRTVVSQTFVGQPVQDLHGHGTHCIGTSCGPKSPPGTTPRYGIAHKAPIFVGKVLSNSGSGATGGVLAGINWAVANRCVVISMSLGSQAPVQTAYTSAGAAALSRGCLIIAAAGNAGSNTGSPASSPMIMSVASLDPTLAPSSFSNFGKIEIAAPGRDIFSAAPRPTRYATMSGTSMATPHVAGCAALWAETSPALRGTNLWKKLQATAKALPFPPSRVGKGLVQAP
ncbi:MAG TPA: S8 family serine peptidase [Vicinamibacterales bacterium]|nr:S8 family serine peptidase [Vicinamibacterales bacterium]